MYQFIKNIHVKTFEHDLRKDKKAKDIKEKKNQVQLKL